MTRSRRLGYGHVATTGLTLLYTCPASSYVLLKYSTLHQNTAGTGVSQLMVQPFGSSDYFRYFTAKAVAADTTFDITSFIVLQPGDQVYAAAGAGDGYAALYGAELPAP